MGLITRVSLPINELSAFLNVEVGKSGNAGEKPHVIWMLIIVNVPVSIFRRYYYIDEVRHDFKQYAKKQGLCPRKKSSIFTKVTECFSG